MHFFRELSPPTLSTRLTLVSLAGFLVAVGALLSFGYWAARTADTLALERQTSFVRSGLAELIARIPVEQESVAIWDDSVLQVRAGNQAWMAENLGEWMGEYFGHDEAYVLDPLNRPVHAMRDGRTLPPASYHASAPQIAPVVSELRAAMADASAGHADSTEAVLPLEATGLAVQSGIPVAISAKPIVPSSSSLQQPAGTEYLHVAVRRIDRDVLTEIAGTYDLEDIGLLPRHDPLADRAGVPVVDETGQVLGAVTWQPDRPGTRMLLAAAPGLAFAVLVGASLLVWLLLRLRRASAELQASQARAQFLAFHDTLTGLPNRALFEDRLDRALIAARRSGSKVALHTIDIDRFKNINDTRGHPAGDELIRLVAARLVASVRDTDTVARLGGDEFMVIQTQVGSIADAEAIAQRLLGAIGEPGDLLGEKAYVTASIGVVVSDGPEIDRDEMLRRADIALYEAKGRGRGRYELFAGDMDEVIRRRRMIEVDLRLALELGTQLKLVYQPLFASDGQTMLGAEALVRWDHPLHGRMPPDLFIGIAEERALIEPLGDFVLTEAASFALHAGLPWVAVNVSPIQFRNSRFAAKVAAILEEVGLPPDRLQLEITEGVLLENAGLIERTLAELRASGVRIALDDFGTGYSSMSYLRRYAIDKLKIDRTFIAELGTSADADAIVRAMIGLARSLRLQVTAEGVETIEQRDHLAAIGCHELQGFLLSRPIEESELLAMIDGARLARSA